MLGGLAPPDSSQCHDIVALADGVRLLVVPQNLAEEQEKAGATEDCISFYSQAAELFAAEDSTSEASKCRQKARVPAGRRIAIRLRSASLHSGF